MGDCLKALTEKSVQRLFKLAKVKVCLKTSLTLGIFVPYFGHSSQYSIT